MNYYPEGSMRGSGIYATEVVLSFDCEECGGYIEEEFTTDDYGNIDDEVECYECGWWNVIRKTKEDYYG